MKPKITAVIPLGEKMDAEVLDTIKAQDEKINFIIERGPNPSINRNRGVKKSKTEIIAFVNGHALLPQDWSRNIRIFFEKYKNIDIVGGPQLTPKNSGHFEKISGYALGSMFGSGGVSSRYSGKRLLLNADETNLSSANFACKKHIFNKIKFDETLYPGEDPKFISDAKKNGFKIAYYPEIIAFNKRRTNLEEFIIQNFKFGMVRPKKETFTETLKRPFFIIPGLFLIYLILLTPLSFISNLFFIPAIVYLISNIFFSAYESVKNQDLKSIFLLPIIFLAIHLSYGAGFIYGVLKKWLL